MNIRGLAGRLRGGLVRTETMKKPQGLNHDIKNIMV